MLGQRLIADMPNKGESMGKSSRRQFLGAVLCALGAENLPAAAKPERVDPKPSDDKAKTPGAQGDLKVRFLGTGVGPMGAKGNECGDWRRHSSRIRLGLHAMDSRLCSDCMLLAAIFAMVIANISIA